MSVNTPSKLEKILSEGHFAVTSECGPPRGSDPKPIIEKAELIKGATQLLVDVLGKNPATTVVVIDEVETDNWGIGGESVTVRRKHGQ